MTKSYYLENIPARHNENPRQFLKPTDAEIENLKPGDVVRLFFVFNFTTVDGCLAERLWVEITDIEGENFEGDLTNTPVFIKDVQAGDPITFTKNNIATVFVESPIDETKKAIISKRALAKQQINRAMRGELNNPEDSGWQLLHGDEDQDYLDDPNNSTIVSLEHVLQFEPRLEAVFTSNGLEFDWDEDTGDFAEYVDNSKKWWQFWK